MWAMKAGGSLGAGESGEVKALEDESKSEVVEITEENIGQYSIHQLVLPLPGMSTRIPAYLLDDYLVWLVVSSEIGVLTENRSREVLLELCST